MHQIVIKRNQPKSAQKNRPQNCTQIASKIQDQPFFFTPQLHNWPYLLRRWLLKKDLSLCFTSSSRFLLFLNFLSILHDFFVFIRSRLINKLMLAICVTQCCGEFFSYFLWALVFRKMTFPYRFPRFSFQWDLLKIVIKCTDYLFSDDITFHRRSQKNQNVIQGRTSSS
jgi:hypothetical protein